MALIDEIQRDIACPKCDYNLRGLAGAVVTCPECGCECDIAKLIARKWTGPWYNAPGLMRITLPAALLFVALVARFLWGMARASPFGPPLTMYNGLGDAGLYLLVAAAWAWLLVRAWDVFATWESIALAALAHAIILAYIGGVIGGIISLLAAVTSDDSTARWGTAGVIASLGAVFLANRGERFMGMRCIAAHLNRPFRESGVKPAND